MIKALLVLSAIFAIAFTQNATYTYKTIDNLNITLDVYIPNESPYAKYPIFFTIHGGGYVESSKHDGLSPLEVTEVLSLGFVYVTIDYRLNPGVLLGDIVQDVQDAYTWVYTELPKYVNVNVDAMIVCGRSAGGGLALIGGYTFNPRPKALLVFYPGNANYTDPAVYNPDTPLPEYIVLAANLLRKPILTEYIPATSIDPYWALFWNAYKAGKNGWLFVSTDAKEPSDQILASLKNFSAVYFVDEQYPPTYFVHGLNDGLVNTNQSIMMANALHAQNIPYVLDLVPGFDHAFDEAITDPNNGTYQEYIVPAFQWAEQMIQNEFGFGTENEKIYN